MSAMLVPHDYTIHHSEFRVLVASLDLIVVAERQILLEYCFRIRIWIRIWRA